MPSDLKTGAQLLAWARNLADAWRARGDHAPASRLMIQVAGTKLGSRYSVDQKRGGRYIIAEVPPDEA